MKETEFESVESKEESEAMENENSDATDTENDVEIEPSVLGDIPSSESGDADIPVTVSDGDVSPGMVSTGDVSTGDATVSPATSSVINPVVTQTEIVCSCSCGDSVPLWESDISKYDTTDGLLLLILVFTVIGTLMSIFRKE